MDRTPVASSNIASVGWESGTLEVEFLNGYVYSYVGVPEGVAREIRTAVSPGKAFNNLVKNRFVGTQIE